MVLASLREGDARAAPIEAEVEGLQIAQRVAHARLRGLRAIEQQEAAAARARDLAAERAGVASALVDRVDRRIADLRGDRALHLPAAVEGAAETVEIAGEQQVAHLVGEGDHPLDAAEGGFVLLHRLD